MLGQHAGYQVEKGTSVNLDVVSIHHDATVFADPEKFNPDRFDVSSSLTYHEAQHGLSSFADENTMQSGCRARSSRTASWGSAAGQGCALA